MSRGFVPTAEEPPLQELHRGEPDYGWRVLVLCVLLNRAGRAQADRVQRRLFAKWPTPAALACSAAAPRFAVEAVVRPCGFQSVRARTLRALSEAWRADADAYLQGALPVEWLPGVGPYAADAFRLFVLGDLDARIESRDPVLEAWRSHLTRDKIRGGRQPAPDEGADTKEARMGTATAIAPKEAREGQTVEVFLKGREDDDDTVGGIVVKNDPKGGRIRVEDGQRRTTHALRYGQIDEIVLQVEEVEQEAESVARPASPTEEDLRAEHEELQRVGRRGWTAKQAERVREIRAALGLDSGGSKGSNGRGKKGGKRAKYPEEITEAVRLAKAARGTTHGAPGAKQHVHVREVVGQEFDNPTAEDLIGAAFAGGGVRASEKKLREIADGTAPKSDLQALRPLAARMSDPFCKGRNLASMLVAWIEQIKAGR